MRQLHLILMMMLVFFPWHHASSQGKVLHEGIYTNTGYGVNDQNEAVNGNSSLSYYVKIYEQKLVRTVSVIGNPQPTDFVYTFKGIDKKGYRVYEMNPYSACLVDKKYDIIEVFGMPSMKYGNNVIDHTYWTVVKGDREKEYNQKHKADAINNPYQEPIDNWGDYYFDHQYHMQQPTYNGYPSSSPVSTSRSRDEIQRDLDKAYDLLHDMERQKEDSRGVVNAAQYVPMISDVRDRIRSLEDELRRASY